ncbi:MAG: hypothetical protein ACFE96_15505 [Candidatus Hermodarchaeota archaeon]
MDTIENLKKLGLKENRKYLILVIWLLVNITIIQLPFGITIQVFGVEMDLLDLLGVVTYVPFLTFLVFTFLYSLVAKKDVKEIASWKVLLTFFLTLPLMFFLIPIMVGIFLFSIFSYIFFTSWFILYGGYLSSKRLDDNLKRRVHSSFYRIVQFFGGSTLAVVLLVGYLLGSQTIGDLVGLTLTQAVYDTLNYVVIFIGIVILLFIIVGIVFMFKKIFNAWLGMFSLMVVIYTFYLIVKIFLALRSTGGEDTSVITQVIMLVLDLLILLYSVSTLMGSQAELLSKKIGIKRIGVDSVLIWLVFSKVAYEFVHNYPFTLFSEFAYIDYIDILDEAIINLSKNIGVLFFFLILLVALGFYQIRKYNLNERKFKDKVDQEVKDLLSPVDFVEQVKEPLHTTEPETEQDRDESEFYEEKESDSDFSENEYSNDSF